MLLAPYFPPLEYIRFLDENNMTAPGPAKMMWKKQLKIKTEFLKQELLKKQPNLNVEEIELSAKVVV